MIHLELISVWCKGPNVSLFASGYPDAQAPFVEKIILIELSWHPHQKSVSYKCKHFGL